MHTTASTAAISSPRLILASIECLLLDHPGEQHDPEPPVDDVEGGQQGHPGLELLHRITFEDQGGALRRGYQRGDEDREEEERQEHVTRAGVAGDCPVERA